MRKNSFILLITFVALSIINTDISAQELTNSAPEPVLQEEQKLMVTIRMEIAEGSAVHVKYQEGFALYPQTVIAALSPMLVLGAKATIIYQDQVIPAIQVNTNARLGLAALLLIRPLAVDTQKTNFFSGKDFGENTFLLTSRSVTNIKNLTEEETKENQLKGAVAVDDYGTLLGIVLSIEKDDFGTLIQRIIPFDYVQAFIRSLEQGPPLPEFKPPELPEDSNAKVYLNTI
ncbi:MAG: hypothetical protein HYX20_00395 [Candidatus Yanofskybacteria bacterium]|nr:hypothetical protein [Candidatus Yanofskybacteria bacterium]